MYHKGRNIQGSSFVVVPSRPCIINSSLSLATRSLLPDDAATSNLLCSLALFYATLFRQCSILTAIVVTIKLATSQWRRRVDWEFHSLTMLPSTFWSHTQVAPRDKTYSSAITPIIIIIIISASVTLPGWNLTSQLILYSPIYRNIATMEQGNLCLSRFLIHTVRDPVPDQTPDRDPAIHT